MSARDHIFYTILFVYIYKYVRFITAWQVMIWFNFETSIDLLVLFGFDREYEILFE